MATTVDRRTLMLALALTPGISGKTIARILTRNDLLKRNEADFMKVGAEALREEYRFSKAVADRWSASKLQQIEEASELQAKLDRFRVTGLTLADAAYPKRIEDFDPEPPGMIFLYGNHRLLEANTFCVLSSRKTRPAMLATIEKLAEEGVLAGETLVSGHDTPEYQRSAVVPLRWGAPRIIVLDKGLFHALGEELDNEPFRAARLWRCQFDPKTDLVVTCLNPYSTGAPEANRRRDRLIASLALRHDYVSINPGGNMDKLARMALSIGRPVRVTDETSEYLEYHQAGAQVLDVREIRHSLKDL